jgi:phospholipid/cholesterol/gamma-HCH transport system substrate-binding protein
MRRIAAILCALVASAAILVVGSGSGGDEGTYEVRAMFDNGAFLVPGEEVRIAGARVGQVSAVDVTGVDEPVHLDGSPEPGKAAITLRIDDAGFQDFRQDASCLIRPQSLLGEKFVECEPTQPHAAGTTPPPPLDEVPDGQPGAGERFLPIESNGKTVDLDLVNNIMREPYADRFRLILNDLGAGLAARGDELAEIVDRSDPALRETNEVLAILARQNRALADLARDGDAVLAPLARDRSQLTGFINSAASTAAATAERGGDLEQGLNLLPQTLREVRSTMSELKRFSDAGTPLFGDLAAAAPAATRATKALGPFADSATTALASLGDAAAASQAPLVGSDPVIKQVRGFANSAAPAATDLAQLLRSFDKKDGFRNLLRFVYRATGAFNGFDNLGHFARAFLLITNCNDYVTAPQSGCIANFLPPTETTETTTKQREHPDQRDKRRPKQPDTGGDRGQGTAGNETAPQAEPPATAPSQTAPGQTAPGESTTPAAPAEPSAPGQTDEATPGVAELPRGDAPGARLGATRALLDFLIGDRHPPKAHQRPER